MFPCHEEKIKWDDYGEFIRCVLLLSTDSLGLVEFATGLVNSVLNLGKRHSVSLCLLLQSRVLKVEFP